MSFVRKSFLAVMLLVSLLLLAACGGSSGENQVKSSGVLRVGTEGVYSPFSYHDAATNELVGYDVDVAKAVADKLGVRVEFVETPWDSIFAALEANRFDIVANEVTINDEHNPVRQAGFRSGAVHRSRGDPREGPARRGDRRSQGGPDEAVPRPNPQPAVERSI